MKKFLAIALAFALVITATIVGTMAYLTSTTEEVENTFTVGKVNITLDEAEVNENGVPVKDGEEVDLEDALRVYGNEYKLVPGHEYTKDPTIHVDKDSEDCWVFAKVENGLGEDGILNIDTSKWTLIDEDNGIYAYAAPVSTDDHSADVDVAPVFTTFTFSGSADPADYEDATINIIGYAIQAEGFDTASAAWSAVYGSSSSST